jgi:replicative DNA helicase
MGAHLTVIPAALTDVDSEQALLGAVLTDPSRFPAVGFVRPEQFFEPALGRLWAAVAENVAAQRPVDFVTLGDRFENDRAVQELGGRGYLFRLWDATFHSDMAPHYASLVIDSWSRRRVSEVLMEGQREIAERAERGSAAIVADIRQALEDLERASLTDDDGLISADDAGEELMATLHEEAMHGRERGLMTGLRCFDRRMGGLRPGWLVIIGARPSMGKSGLARAAAYGAAWKNPQALFLFFSLEMDKREITERALAAITHTMGDGIAYNTMGPKLTPEDREILRQARRQLPRNVLIDDRSTLSVDDVRRRIWAAKRRGPVAAVFIDYLQLMVRPPMAGRNEASVLGEMTSALKRIAREAGVCIVLLSQLNRAVEGRDDKRPQLADLRESGSIEQDANAVLFPYREAYYIARNEPKDVHSPEYRKWQTDLEMVRRRMDVIAAKVRGGAIGKDVQTYFQEYDHVEDSVE